MGSTCHSASVCLSPGLGGGLSPPKPGESIPASLLPLLKSPPPSPCPHAHTSSQHTYQGMGCSSLQVSSVVASVGETEGSFLGKGWSGLRQPLSLLQVWEGV